MKVAHELVYTRRVRRGQGSTGGVQSSFRDIPSCPLPQVVRRQDGIVLGQIRIEVARVQILVRLAAVEQFLRGSVFRFESRAGKCAR